MFDKIVAKDCTDIIKNTNLSKIKNKKILILGGNSFIGNYLQAVLSQINCKIVSVSLNKPKGIIKGLKKNFKFIEADINDEKKTKKIFKNKFDFIFHLATYGQPKKWKQNELSTINLNINLLKNVLEYSVKHKSKISSILAKIIFLISGNDSS